MEVFGSGFYQLIKSGVCPEVNLGIFTEVKLASMLIRAMNSGHELAVKFLLERKKNWDSSVLIDLGKDSINALKTCIERDLISPRLIIEEFVNKPAMTEVLKLAIAKLSMDNVIEGLQKDCELFKLANTEDMVQIFVGNCDNGCLFYHALKRRWYKTIDRMRRENLLIRKNILRIINCCNLYMMTATGVDMDELSIIKCDRDEFSDQEYQDLMKNRVIAYGSHEKFNLDLHLRSLDCSRFFQLTADKHGAIRKKLCDEGYQELLVNRIIDHSSKSRFRLLSHLKVLEGNRFFQLVDSKHISLDIVELLVKSYPDHCSEIIKFAVENTIRIPFAEIAPDITASAETPAAVPSSSEGLELLPSSVEIPKQFTWTDYREYFGKKLPMVMIKFGLISDLALLVADYL